MKSQPHHLYQFTGAPGTIGRKTETADEDASPASKLRRSANCNMYLFVSALDILGTAARKAGQHPHRFQTKRECSMLRYRTFASLSSISNDGSSKIALDLRGTPLSSAGLHAMRQAYSTSNAAVTKGTCAHELGRRASEILRNAREQVRSFIGAESCEEIAFYPSTFDAMKTLASSYCQILRREEEVILGDLGDQHSQVWETTSKQGLFRIVHATDMSLSAMASLISSKTRLFVLRSASAFGNVHEFRDTLEFLQALEIPVILDVSDTLQYGHLQVEERGVDFVVADGTRLGAPAAFLYGKRQRLERLPPAFGGEQALLQYTCSDERSLDIANWGPIPERFETGMPCLPTIASLGTVVEHYIDIMSRPITRSMFENQARYLHEQLQLSDGLLVYGDAENRAPFVCFNVSGADSLIVVDKLREHGILVRVGCHDSRQAHEKNNVSASLRVDVSLESHTKDDIDHFVESLRAIVGTISQTHHPQFAGQ